MLQHRLVVASLFFSMSCQGLATKRQGAGPGEGAVHERAFVSQTGSANVAVIDLATGAVEKHIPTGFIPHNLVLSPDGAKLYVAAAGSQSVAQIDVARAELTATWLTSPVPETRADGSVIQAHFDQDAFARGACQSCHRDAGVKPRYVGNRPVALRLSDDGARLYVCEINSGDVVVLDTASGERLASVNVAAGALKEPAAIALMGGALYVTVRATQPTKLPGLLRKLDPETLDVLADIPIASTDPVELVTTPERDALLLTHFDSDQLSLVDAGGAARGVSVANGPLGITPLSGRRALVLGYYSNAVSLVDLTAGAAETFALTLGDKPLVNPTHAAPSADPDIVWVVQSGTVSSLVALDTRLKKVTRSVPLDGLSYDVVVVPYPEGR